MDTTMYRRRVSGRGSRTAGKRRSAGLSVREKRRLLQLCASILLFLLVFVGRGVMPGQMAAWGEALNSDMDLNGAISVFGQTVSEGESVLTALLQGISALGGETDLPPTGTGDSEEETIVLPELVSYVQRMREPGFQSLHLLTLPGVPQESFESVENDTPEEEAPPEEEPVVTAVAQLYDESGASLPERVSFQCYNLGLEETAVPVMGEVTSAFGFRDHPVSGDYTFHTAIDVGVDCGTEVLAFADGTVRYIGENGVFGLYVKLDHDNGVSTFYAHCEELLVSKGERVVCGQVIALSGETGNATGPHLHFSLEKDGIRLDPEYYLDL